MASLYGFDHCDRISQRGHVVSGFCKDASNQGAQDGLIVEYENAGPQGGAFCKAETHIPALQSTLRYTE